MTKTGGTRRDASFPGMTKRDASFVGMTRNRHDKDRHDKGEGVKRRRCLLRRHDKKQA